LFLKVKNINPVLKIMKIGFLFSEGDIHE
jgi:hypothetical protein